ncbi:MAG: alanine:cation symporter family protein, partial [Planctomycetaceae bacterium]|nr:alanine:cation symporter family protein [Planctomycetaceae bacterium]
LNILRFVFLFVTFFSGIDAKSLAWDMADIGAGLMAWLNLIALILLSNLSLKVFFDYEKQVKRGIINPTFDPEKLGIKNTTEWKKDSDSIDDKDKHISYSRIGC